MPEPVDDTHSRRSFLDRVGLLSFSLAAPAFTVEGAALAELSASTGSGNYDLSWIEQLRGATDRGLVDSTQASRVSLMIATRYLDNCDAAYGVGQHRAKVVLNLRTRAVPLGVKDELWRRYELGVEAGANDPATNAPALRNVFVDRPPGMIREEGALAELVARGAILLICDFALGHVARSVVNKRGGVFEDVHRELTTGLIPGAYAVPSGIFGAIRAQNAGCGYVGGV
jgi:hypothetical protein